MKQNTKNTKHDNTKIILVHMIVIDVFIVDDLKWYVFSMNDKWEE